MTTGNADVDTIVGDPAIIHLDGADIDVKVEQLRTRQTFKFLRILTVGAGPALADLQLSDDIDAGSLAQELLGVLLVSIPEAEDEVMDFLKSMVSPVDLVAPERSKADRQANVEKYTELYTTLDNPELEDTIKLITHIVKTEAPNLKALGKTVAALLPSAAKPTTSSKPRSKKQTPSTS